MRQLAELAFVRLPSAPIGVGATWETHHESGERNIRSMQIVRCGAAKQVRGATTSKQTVELDGRPPVAQTVTSKHTLTTPD